MSINFSEMSKAKLHRYGAHTVGTAMEIHISEKDVTPLEASSRRYWFRIGEMYFDLIADNDGTTTLTVSNRDDVTGICIASFRADGSIVRAKGVI
jgi:hypothetical protein